MLVSSEFVGTLRTKKSGPLADFSSENGNVYECFVFIRTYVLTVEPCPPRIWKQSLKVWLETNTDFKNIQHLLDFYCIKTCKGHDAVVSLSAGDDMRPAEA